LVDNNRIISLWTFSFWLSANLCWQTISKIKIDGFLDEPDWQKAKVINFYHLMVNSSGIKTISILALKQKSKSN